jgi:ABC-2 type transport system permease protein
VNKVWLVTKREVMTQVSSRAFQIGSAIMVLLAFLGAMLPGMFAGKEDSAEEKTKIAVAGSVSDLGPVLLDGFDVSTVPDPAVARAAVSDGSVAAALIEDPTAEPLGWLIVAKTEPPDDLLAALTVSPAVELLEPPNVGMIVKAIASMVFAVVFFMIVIMFGQTAATNTVVEKQTRVIEILLAAVPARVLLAGKILGNAVLAFATVVALLAAGVAGALFGGLGETLKNYQEQIGAALGGETSLLSMFGPALAWFAVFFLVAFVMFSSLMAGSAAMVSRIEEVGSVLTPTIMLVMIPYFLVIFFQDNLTVMRWLSYIPFSSPIAMPLRLVIGDAVWWEAVVALLILTVTTLGSIYLGGRIYSNSILRTGARTKLQDALKSAA